MKLSYKQRSMDSSLKTHLANNIATRFSVMQYLRCLLVILSVSQTLPLSNSYVSHRLLWQKTVHHKNGGVFVPMLVGNAEQYVIFDTGSKIFWIQCHPCDPCVHQNTPYYYEDPNKILPSADCPQEDPFFVDDGLCAYRMSYADGTTTRGKLAQEALQTSTGEYLVFGCSNNTTPNSAFRSARITGVLGMGRGSGSFMEENRVLCNDRFSFCIRRDRVESQMGFMSVGRYVRVHDSALKMEMIEGRVAYTYYDVPLESMSYSNRGSHVWHKINVDRGTFDGGCVLDTGTGMTRLVADAYDEIVGVMDRHFKFYGFRKNFSNDGFEEVCYEPKKSTDWRTVPRPPLVRLRFKGIYGPIYMIWEEWQLFDSDEFGGMCLQILPSSDTYTVIGAYQMTDTYFAFDLVENRISFFPNPHCEID